MTFQALLSAMDTMTAVLTTLLSRAWRASRCWSAASA